MSGYGRAFVYPLRGTQTTLAGAFSRNTIDDVKTIMGRKSFERPCRSSKTLVIVMRSNVSVISYKQKKKKVNWELGND